MEPATRARGTTQDPDVSPRVAEFEASYGFPFDDFQRHACTALETGSSVLVAAPTGAGKTVVGEFAAWMSVRGGGRTFYTTPIKALSNQKYGDFLDAYGPERVGLLTGDNSINGGAPIVVMTTEVLRNMIYEDPHGLAHLEYVVLDEVHYLQNRYRGAVWEEILIHLPVDVQTASLSATVSNAEEFAEWLQTLRGRTEVIIEERRPVDIRHWYMAADELLPMFVTRNGGDAAPNPRGVELDRRRRRGPRPPRGGRREREKRARTPLRTEVIERLHSEDMLPAIYFIFSRRGCDDAVKTCLRENVRLTSSEERRRIMEYADLRVADLPPEELDVLGYPDWISGLVNGIAAHHAGMIPPFKETVEELFKRGLIKVVFATETLSLGINMPARSVVIESLTKFTGERHELLTPGEYTQLSGRAGRRGIDELGHCVVLMQRFTPFETITRLASTRTYPLNSSFQPSYNMAVNLVRNYDRHDAEHLVNSSFAQFQADRDVVQLERNLERNEAYLASYRERMKCDQGDTEGYRRLHDKLKDSEARARATASGGAIADAMMALGRGDVVVVSGGKKRGRHLVLDVTRGRGERNPKLLVLSEERSVLRLTVNDFRQPPRAAARLNVPKGVSARDPKARRELARRLQQVDIAPPRAPDEPKGLRTLRKRVEQHPVHGCPDRERHLHFAERAARLERDIRGIRRRIGRRTGTLARRFEQVLHVLDDLGYVDDWSLTAKGDVLTRIYNESDLLVTEAIARGVLDGLDAAEIAAVCSTLVYETRGPEPPPVASFPTEHSFRAWKDILDIFGEIKAHEEARGLELTREPDPGVADKAFRWAAGAPLDLILTEDDAPGDFVRWVKQLIDLLRQIEEVMAPGPASDAVRDAIDGIHRGVAAYSSLDV
ncbi:MAG TPA: DEAD/DEAH box helicase [Actinomycetota bacterium]|nr:DEAD/DEAH box helicase [Actinomycetota bacterium]